MPERQGHVQTARGLTCPLIFERGHLFATAGNGTFLLDTGAPVSFGRVSAVTLDGQRFTVAPTYLGLTKEVLSSHVGRDVDGLLGADILNQFDTLIDVGHSRVLFSEGPVEFGGEELALDDFMGIPILTATIISLSGWSLTKTTSCFARLSPVHGSAGLVTSLGPLHNPCWRQSLATT